MKIIDFNEVDFEDFKNTKLFINSFQVDDEQTDDTLTSIMNNSFFLTLVSVEEEMFTFKISNDDSTIELPQNSSIFLNFEY